MAVTPQDLAYHREHMWARRETAGVRIGITDFAQDALSSIVFVQLPEPGTQVQQGKPCGEVESTKTVSDIIAPTSGTIIARNDALQGDPELVNRDPYGDGWMLLLDADEESAGLLSPEQYAEQTNSA